MPHIRHVFLGQNKYLLFSNVFCDSTFVNGRGREAIVEEMRKRIDRHDVDREIEETIQACFTPLFKIQIYIYFTVLQWVFSVDLDFDFSPLVSRSPRSESDVINSIC